MNKFWTFILRGFYPKPCDEGWGEHRPENTPAPHPER